MRLSSLRAPKWWQRLWRSRYPMGAEAALVLYPEDGARTYTIRPMGCGCGYRVSLDGEVLGHHCPTLGMAIRRARDHAAGVWPDPDRGDLTRGTM